MLFARRVKSIEQKLEERRRPLDWCEALFGGAPNHCLARGAMI
jgi:hypothetical protein